MKIAMIGQKGIPAHYGGVETHVEELSKRLASKEHQITVFSRNWYAKENEDSLSEVKLPDNIERVFTSTISTKHLDTITHTFTSTFNAIFKDYDVIHYHGVGPSLLTWVTRIFSSAKIVSTFHCIDRKHGKWGWLAQLALRIGEWACCTFPHRTIAVSKNIHKYVKEVYNRDITYITNGVPLFEPNEKTDKIKQWDLQSDRYLLLVSRLIAHKGIHYAIEAYKNIKQEKPELIEDLKLVIVGEGHFSDKYVDKVKKMAESETDIIMTGFQTGSALEQLFSHAKLMISPSDLEGLPITVLEGMSYKLPVMLSDIPEHTEIIDSTEFLFEQGNIDDLQKTLEELLKSSDKKLQKQGQKNRNIIEQKYSWKYVTNQIEKLYQEITQSS